MRQTTTTAKHKPLLGQTLSAGSRVAISPPKWSLAEPLSLATWGVVLAFLQQRRPPDGLPGHEVTARARHIHSAGLRPMRNLAHSPNDKKWTEAVAPSGRAALRLVEDSQQDLATSGSCCVSPNKDCMKRNHTGQIGLRPGGLDLNRSGRETRRLGLARKAAEAPHQPPPAWVAERGLAADRILRCPVPRSSVCGMHAF